MQLIDFDGIALPDRMVSFAVPRRVEVSRMRVAGGGSYALGAAWDAQEYGADGLYHETGAAWIRDSVLDDLRQRMGRTYTLRGKTANGSIRRCEAWLTEINPTHDNESCVANIQRVSLRFSASPFWYDDIETVATLTSATQVFAVNSGNAPTSAKLTITSAIASSLAITNTTTGDALTYGAAKSSGVVLVIDDAGGAVTADGANVYGNTSRAATQIALLQFAAGQNKLTFSVAVTGELRYRGCWA